jgi:hypothetical protein
MVWERLFCAILQREEDLSRAGKMADEAFWEEYTSRLPEPMRKPLGDPKPKKRKDD